LTRFYPLIRRLILATLALATPAWAQPQTWAWDDGTVPFVVTPAEIVERMMRMAEVRKDDYLIDLGSGDGRIVIEAAKRGARGLGVDLDPNLVKAATENARLAGVGERTRFEVRDIFETDLAGATVVAFYLLPDFNAKLLPRLLKLKPGTRIVSHDGGIADWPADESLEMRVPEKPVGVGGQSRVDLWIVPADAAGLWTSTIGEHGGAWRFRIGQKFQVLDIDAAAGGIQQLVRNSRLRGEEIKMVLTGQVRGRFWYHYFVGSVSGDRIDGTLTVYDGNNQRVYPWRAQRSK
jgi:SAM-dependent methyltransferase